MVYKGYQYLANGGQKRHKNKNKEFSLYWSLDSIAEEVCFEGCLFAM